MLVVSSECWHLATAPIWKQAGQQPNHVWTCPERMRFHHVFSHDLGGRSILSFPFLVYTVYCVHIVYVQKKSYPFITLIDFNFIDYTYISLRFPSGHVVLASLDVQANKVTVTKNGESEHGTRCPVTCIQIRRGSTMAIPNGTAKSWSVQPVRRLASGTWDQPSCCNQHYQAAIRSIQHQVC